MEKDLCKCKYQSFTKKLNTLERKLLKAQSFKIAEIQLKKAQKNIDEGQVYIFTLNKKYDINGNVLN